jgi:hypothetical protein
MTMSVWLINLIRVVHVLSTSAWLGGAVINTAFLMPSVTALGPAGGPVMRQLVQVRRLPLFMSTLSALAAVSGLALYGWRMNLQPGWAGSRSGIVFGVGGLLGLVAALLGIFFIGATAKRLSRLAAEAQAAGGPPAPETAAALQRLQVRMRLLSQAAVLLLLLAAAAMAVGRYS